MLFENLDVWKRSSHLACQVYLHFDNCNNYGFKDQITRSALSIPSNIAEGEERQTSKEKIRFLYYSKGSTGELVTQLYIGIKIGFINKELGLSLINETKQISRMIGAMIKKKRDC
ncbi:four helix bundle protein [Thalassotalea nanhaiensis]|uniref:Four helix bundle protein n=1 Tax=Thalassotalea nanhaiensis TaxID=3065648 RepID=A0ABY9TDZ8_9GAMM|nr:four helix bundle protein [Colwelliaceae bacterium SQ345]